MCRSCGFWTDEHFASFLDTAKAKYGTNVAAIGKNHLGIDTVMTYDQLAESVDKLALRLSRAGIGASDFVIVQLPNRIDFVQTIFALFRLGARPIFTLPSHRDTELSAFLEQSRATALITMNRHSGYDYSAMASRLKLKFPQLNVFISGINPSEHQPLFLETDLAESAEKSLPATTPWSVKDTEDIAFLQVSGGTTGIPKLIPRSHAAYIYSVRESARICQLDHNTVFLVSLPAAHNFTMSSPGILGVLYTGGTLVFAEDPSPSTAFKLIEQYRVTFAATVPPLALLWLDFYPQSQRDISSLQVLQVGGAKFTPESARRIKPELGCQLQQVFGMAEGLVNYTRLDDPDDVVIFTQGRPMSPADEIMVLDSWGKPVSPGDAGLLWTRGPYTIRNYFHGVNSESFSPDGFYCSGDVVRQLPNGYLVVEGREKDQINRAGEKISPEEIEDHLICHEALLDVTVVGLSSAQLGESTCAFVLLKDDYADMDSKTLSTQLRAFLKNRHLAPHKIPDRFIFASDFPLTGVGKISRNQLRVQLADFIQNQPHPEGNAIHV